MPVRIINRTFFLSLVYALVGIAVGLWLAGDVAHEDVAIGKMCATTLDCWSRNFFFVPVAALLWPILLLFLGVDNPILLGFVLVVLAIVIWWKQHGNDK